MNYRIRATGEYPVSRELLAARHRVGLPAGEWGPHVLDYLGVDPVVGTPAPTPPDRYHAVREAAPVLTDKGHWEQAWEVIDRRFGKTPEELAELEAQITTEQNMAVERLMEAVGAAVQIHLDAKARERRYDSIHTAKACQFSKVEKFRLEGQACQNWYDEVWAQCEALLAEVLAGARAPLTPDEVVALLPVLTWPD